MPIQRDGKVYYMQEEMDIRMKQYIRKTGEDMVRELKTLRKEDAKKEEYV